MLAISISFTFANCFDKKISKSIKKYESNITCSKWKLNNFYNFRNDVDIFNKLKVNLDNDTVYIVDMFPTAESINLNLSAWNSKRIINYEYKYDFAKRKYAIDRSKDNYLSNYKINLISNWNIEQIKIESQDNQLIEKSVNTVTRIIFNNKKYKIDFFAFDEYFILEKELLEI